MVETGQGTVRDILKIPGETMTLASNWRTKRQEKFGDAGAPHFLFEIFL